MRMLIGVLALLIVVTPAGVTSMPVPSGTSAGPRCTPHAGGAADQGRDFGGGRKLAIVAGVFLVATTSIGVANLLDSDKDNDAAGYWLLLPAVSMGIGAFISWCSWDEDQYVSTEEGK